MDLGRFSISLAVKDLKKSQAFYEAIGFAMVAGEPEKNWVILQNGEAKVGLFQGMFENNLMTFNPKDARAIEKAVVDAGYDVDSKTGPGEGPTHFMMRDPDGNQILVDQH